MERSSVNAADLAGRFALDARDVSSLKLQARTDQKGALKNAAQQFEALFLNMLLKSMREAMDQPDGLFDSDQTKMYTAMLDQQLAQSLSRRGIGLAEVIERQLTQGALAVTGAAPAAFSLPPALQFTPPSPGAVPGVAPTSSAAESGPAAGGQPPHVREFVNRMWPHAVAAARETGIPPHFILGQAALESGWGRAEIRQADGSTTHNLFGIKAGRGWSGATADIVTTEYVNGTAQKSVERFRAYGSYEEAFMDYARLLRSNPRYAAVLDSGRDAVGFAQGLQQAGYATDPMYADKLLRVINGSVLRQGLMG